MEIIKHIAYLLHRHECVILPEFGAFIGHDSPALFQEINAVAKPDFRSVSFNESIKRNDGLLAQSLADSKGITYAEANLEIRSCVIAFKNQLASDRNLEFGKLGMFYLGKEDKLLFVARHNTNLEPRSYGLPILKLKKFGAPVAVPELSAKQSDIKTAEKQALPIAKPALKEKRKNHKESPAPKRRLKPLTIMNSIGLVFLIALTFAVLNQEYIGNKQGPPLVEQASIIDSQGIPENNTVDDARLGTKKKEGIRNILAAMESRNKPTEHQILIDGTYGRDEVDKLKSRFEGRFPQIQIIEVENEMYTLQFGSFINQELAVEYKELISRSLNRPLTIRTK